MKVAIYGSYLHNNYGDDLMAVMYAQHLKKLGCEPMVFRLEEELSQKLDIPTTFSLSELIEGASFCMIGGGAFLVSDFIDDIEDTLVELVKICTEKKCNIHAISIGGDGSGEKTKFGYGKAQLYCSEVFAESTVRIPEDIDLLKKYHKKAYFYHDVLWGVDSFFGIKHQNQEGQLHIGINLPDLPQYRKLMEWYAKISNNKVTFIQLHSTKHVDIPELGFNSNDGKATFYINHDPIETMQVMSKLDLIITCKMHLGLTALAMGIPFVSIGGQSKTHKLLQLIKANFAIYTSGGKGLAKALWEMRSKESVAQFKSKFNFKLIDELKQNSLGHLDFLKQLTELYK